MCGEKVVDGGTWAGVTEVHLVSICNKRKCIEEQIKWVLDAFTSSNSIDIRHFQAKKEFMDMVEKVYEDKANHSNHNK